MTDTAAQREARQRVADTLAAFDRAWHFDTGAASITPQPIRTDPDPLDVARAERKAARAERKAESIAAAAAIDAAEERIEAARRELAAATATHRRAVARGTHLKRRTADAVADAEDALDAATAHRATLQHTGIGSRMRAGSAKRARWERDGLDAHGRTPAEARAAAHKDAADRRRAQKQQRSTWVALNVMTLGVPAAMAAMTKGALPLTAVATDKSID
jgi:hypothetical protein